MNRLSVSSIVCQGIFFGGDIEPGTFHGGEIEPGTFHATQKNSNSEKENVSGDDGEMPDLDDENNDRATGSDAVNITCY